MTPTPNRITPGFVAKYPDWCARFAPEVLEDESEDDDGDTE